MNELCLAVSGLHRGDNPQPGAGIIRSIRRAFPQAHIIGLVYNVMESGIYVESGADECLLLSYPTAGADAFFQRLDARLKRRPIDILIPSLDAELELLVHFPEELARRGIRACLPDPAALRRRAKERLPALARACGVAVPETRVAHDVFAAAAAAVELGHPLMIKGAFYEANKVFTTPQAQYTAAHLLTEWGAPVILQRCVAGPEFNVLGIGDGRGGHFGLCSIRKTVLSDKGKGIGGITINDERLTRLCANLLRELRWKGPFEIELIYDESRREYVLIEINPRFPAWIDFPAMIGANFSAALVRLLLDGDIREALPTCRPGSFFLRHQVEVVGEIGSLAGLFEEDLSPTDSSTVDQPLLLS